jgi:dTDP-4-dehydrorhamnose 3,5-epimerase
VGALNTADIAVTKLSRFSLEDGDVLHALKKDEESYAGFGEAYFSWIKQDAVKAWKRHNNMTMNLVVPVGMVRFVFCTKKENDEFEYRVEEIGENAYFRLTVPPGIWFGFMGLVAPASLILNISNTVHDSIEVERLSVQDLPYNW